MSIQGIIMFALFGALVIVGVVKAVTSKKRGGAPAQEQAPADSAEE